MKFTAKELAQALHGTVEGNPEEVVSSFAKIEHGKPGQICFYANPKYEQYVYTSRASILLVNSDFTPKQPVTPTLIRVPDAYSALAELLKYAKSRNNQFHRRRSIFSRVACSAKLGRKVWVKCLFEQIDRTDDEYVKTFCLDQLRWCGTPCQASAVRALGARSSKGVKEFADWVARELEAAGSR